MACDVSRAYFYAAGVRPVYAKIVNEHYEPGGEDRCGRLNVSMYGTRDAALNWHQHCKGHLKIIGFAQGRSCPRIFYHAGSNIRVFIRGGDYVASGADASVKWMTKEMKARYECKEHIFGSDKSDESQVNV